MIHLTIQQLSASLDGALTGPSLDLVVRHLATCPECRERQARLVRTDDALRRLLAQQTTDAFLDDLSMRAESWIAAIAQGLPEPNARPHAHVPPSAPTAYTPPPMPEPPPAPSPSVVHQAGWGVIGMKPSVPAQAPASDPDETRRLLEAMERAERTTAATPTTPNPTPAADDLPTWLQEQARIAAQSQLPQGPGLAQASAPPTAPFPREAAAPAWPLPQPAVESPRPWFVPSPTPAPVLAVPQEHAAYAPPAMLPSSPSQSPAPAPTSASMPATVAAPAFPQPPAPEPIAAHHVHTLPGTQQDRYLSFEQHRQLTRTAFPWARHAITFGITLLAGAALVFAVLQLAPVAVRERLGDRLREIVQRRMGTNVTTITPVTPTATPSAKPTNVTTPVVGTPVDELVPVEAAGTANATTVTLPPTESATTTPIVPTVATSVATTKPVAVTPVASATGKTVITPTDASHWLQTCGTVVDGKGAAIAGARITVTEIALTLRTDAQGRFCIAAPAGAQHLLVEAPGFTPVRQSVRFADGSPDLRLQLARTH